MEKSTHKVIPVQVEFDDLNDYFDLTAYDYDFRNYELRTTTTPGVYKIYNKINKLSYTGTLETMRKKVIKYENINEKKYWRLTYEGESPKFKDRFEDEWYERYLKKDLLKMFDYLNTYFPEDIESFLKKNKSSYLCDKNVQ